MDTKKSPKYSLPDEIATQLICSYCYEFLSCGPIKMYKGTYACGRCVINKEDEIILPQIFENFLANFTFPCKYYKEGCEKNVQFNGTQKHESKCTYRKISCPKLNCVETILTVNLYNHFQKHHISQIIENSQFRINLNKNDIQNLIANESECIVVIKYCYSQATKSLQLSIAPVNEKFQTVDRYKLQICNEHDVDNNISLSQKICHLYNGPYLETGYFDDINLSNYLSILNNPKVVIIKIFLIYSSKTSLTTETLITNNTSEFALLNDVDEENARQILEKCIEDTKSNANSFEYRTRNRIKPLRKTNRNFLSVFEYTDTYEYSDSDSFYLCVDEPKDLVPCQWKGCKHSYKEQEILKHQDECEFKLYICPFLADCQQEKMTMEPSPKYMLPDDIAKKMICSYCNGFLSCGPIKMQKGSYICGRCDIKGKDDGVLPHIFEVFMDNFTFPCKYYKEGCTKTVLFNDTQKHEVKCSHRIIMCPELHSCDEILLIMNLYDHFQKYHINRIIENCQFKLDLNENGKQNLLIYESDCVVVVKYSYIQATKNLQLSVAPLNEKIGTVDKYKLQIYNGDDVDNNISLSQKLCHLYNSKHLKTGEFDNINLSDYLSILNDPKVLIIKIILIYSNDSSVTNKTLITNKTGKIAQIDDIDEENASEKLKKRRSRVAYRYEDNNTNTVPCKWKDCIKSDEKQNILKHQDECEFRLYICPFLEDCEEEKMESEESPKYILPDKIATKLICSYCKGHLSCGPIRIQKGMYACGRCITNRQDEAILPQIFEDFLANFTFPCKYRKDGCNKTVLFNDTQKHEAKCSYRMIPCPELNCTATILTSNLYKHFQKHHVNRIIENCELKLDLNKSDEKNLLICESGIIIVIKYCYSQATKSLQLTIAPVNEKFRTVDKYKLQVCNENDVENNISFSQKLCHLYNYQHLETGEYDNINLSDYLSILNDPKVVIIKILLLYSNNISTETLIADKIDKVAPLNDVVEETARNILQKYTVDRNTPSYSYYNYPPVNKIKDSRFPCQWKGCNQSDDKQTILKHQEECKFKLHICPFIDNCEQGLYKFNSSFLSHLETHGQHCPNPNEIVILLYNPTAPYPTEKVCNYFTILNRAVVRITCTMETSGDWKLVCSSSIGIKVEKSQRSGSGVDDLYTSHLWYFNLLLFLTDHELPTTSIDNIEELTQELDLEVDNNKKMNPPTSLQTPQIPTPTPVDRTELQLLLKAIPEYQPGYNLSIFISEVDSLLKHLNGRLSTDLVYAVEYTIRSKLIDEARDFIAYQNVKDWSSIKSSLLQKYGDHRSEDLLVLDLRRLAHTRAEHYLNFYNRILKALNDLMQYVQLYIRDDNLKQG
ncbi:hypothetical protein RN001_013239 [Aquatica leii]|uniref:SIAH-type domain-containing protein n=1 Tax=Aquatica leii TaxID=1421715 RepID=A0AAN7NZV0_9COLE|nr:hypothetical protein RN001_013239 [Aquatica leii]